MKTYVNHQKCLKCGKCACDDPKCNYSGPDMVEHCSKCLQREAQSARLPFDPKKC